MISGVRSSGPPSPRWSVLIYQDSDSNLQDSMDESLQQLLKTPMPSGVQVVVQSNARRYVVSSDGAVEVERIAPRPHAEALQQFLTWAHSRYPSERTMVVLGGHGEGFGGLFTDPKAAPCTSGVPLQEVRAALQSVPVDVLGLDACLMGQIEALHELQGSAPVVVASEEVVGAAGWPYARILSGLPAEAEPAAAARHTVDVSRHDQVERMRDEKPSGVLSLAQYDMAAMPAVEHAMRSLVDTVLAEQVPPDQLRIAEFQSAAMNRGMPVMPFVDYRDLAGFALGLRSDEELSTPVRDAADRLLQSLAALVPHLHHAGEGLTRTFGVSSYLPSPFLDASPEVWTRYQSNSLTRSTGWNRLIEYMTG